MESAQEDTSKKTEIKTTSTTTTVIKETREEVNPEAMTRDDLLEEIAKITSGRRGFWSDQAKEAWIKRLETRAIALSTVEILKQLETLMAPRT